MDSKSGMMIIASLALLLITGFHGTAMSSGTQREAEVAAFYTAGLPSHMVEELESIQARRTEVNADIEGRLQAWNSYAMRYKKARISCAYRELNDVEKTDCDNLRQSLEEEGARFHQLAIQDKQNLAAVIQRYEDFKARANAWLDQHAAKLDQRAAKPL